MMIGSIAGPSLAAMFAPDGQELNSFEGKGQISPVAMMSQTNALMNALGKALTSRAMTPISLASSVVQQPGAYTGGGLPFPIGNVATDPALANPSLLNLQGMGEFEELNRMFSGAQNGQYAFPSMTPGGTPGGAPGGMTGADSIIPGSGIDPDGPLGWDAPLGEGAFGDFYLPSFDQRTPQNPNGTTDGGEPRQGNAAESRTGDGTGPRRKGLGLRASDILNDGASGLGTKIDAGGDDLNQAHGAAQLLMDALGGGDDAFLDELLKRGTFPPSYGKQNPSFEQFA